MTSTIVVVAVVVVVVVVVVVSSGNSNASRTSSGEHGRSGGGRSGSSRRESGGSGSKRQMYDFAQPIPSNLNLCRYNFALTAGQYRAKVTRSRSDGTLLPINDDIAPTYFR